MRGVLYLYIIALLMTFGLMTKAEAKGAVSKPTNSAKQDTTLTVSLITCWPGSEIYELCGHEAIRIKGEGIDSVWNFGLFDFTEPNFVYRFVKGETDYSVGGYPFSYFLPEYIQRGSKVAEQVLNLTPAQARKIREMLQIKSLPQNRRYRYNYIRNNCSTQVADIIDEATDGKIEYNDSVRYGSFREVMSHYHKNYPWYQFGINLALGSELDQPLKARDEFFVPTEYFRYMSTATLPGGAPVVKQTNILNEGRDDAVLPPTPWYGGPLFWSIVVAAISVLTILLCRKGSTGFNLWYSIYYGIAGLAGCLIFFLVFFSEHAATSPNMLIFWLYPLQLIIPALIWNNRFRPAVNAMMWINICVSVVMLIFWPIYSKGQSHEASFLILIGSDLLLSAFYALKGKQGEQEKSKAYKGKKPRRQTGTKTNRKKKK